MTIWLPYDDECSFVERGVNVLAFGLPGTGTTHSNQVQLLLARGQDELRQHVPRQGELTATWKSLDTRRPTQPMARQDGHGQPTVMAEQIPVHRGHHGSDQAFEIMNRFKDSISTTANMTENLTTMPAGPLRKVRR